MLAAAILCEAGTIVTFNLKDFPAETLAPLGITAQHPDEFIEHAFGISPAAVIGAVHDHCASLTHPRKTVDELLDGYLKQGLVTTASLLRPYAAQIRPTSNAGRLQSRHNRAEPRVPDAP